MANGDHPSILEEDPYGSKVSRPRAWQPLTPRGVAAFSVASFRRLFLVESLVASILAFVLIRFLLLSCLPVVRSAVVRLPDDGRIQDQQLKLFDPSPRLLAESRFFSLALDPQNASSAGSTSDFRIELHDRSCQVCSLFGCLAIPYPEHYLIALNPRELEAGIDAWRIMAMAIVACTTWLSALLIWSILATFYCLGPWLLALYHDRQLTLAGSWRLSSAALMPGALLATCAFLAYSLGLVDLIRLVIFLALHLPVGWVWLVLATMRLPRAADSPAQRPNPFLSPSLTPPSDNPFAGPPNTPNA